jgi:hypothetical protein
VLLIAIRRSRVERGATTYDKRSHTLDHFDNVVIMGRLQEAAKYLHHWSKKTSKVGLEIN